MSVRVPVVRMGEAEYVPRGMGGCRHVRAQNGESESMIGKRTSIRRRRTTEDTRLTLICYGISDEKTDEICGPARAPRARRTVPTPESRVLAQCLAYLRHRTRWCHRMNSGAYRDGRRWIRYGFTGLPDIMAQLRDGRILYVECKSAVGVLSDAQRKFLAEVQSPHVVAMVARGVEDLVEHGL